ncbi:MAG TPA: hypothetical protein VHF89_07415, partial [Solirubrobacteraceae bacterium]|nr:hypothetical protein [Solirubrobacteraceae bacterium]
AWNDYDHIETRVRHPDGTLGPKRAVTCTAPTGAQPVPLGLDAGGRGVLALAQTRHVVHEPGWLLTTEDPDVEPLADCPLTGAITVTPTPTPPGPVVIDLSETADRRFSANWWSFDLDGDGTYEALTHDGVVETVVHDDARIRYMQCSGAVYDAERACSGPREVWIGVQDPWVPPPIPPSQWLAEHPQRAAPPAPPPDPPAPDPPAPTAEQSRTPPEHPALAVVAPTTADLARTLRRGVQLTVAARRATDVRVDVLTAARRRVGRSRAHVPAGGRRSIAVRLRRGFARRARRSSRVALTLHVAGGGVSHRLPLVLRRGRR